MYRNNIKIAKVLIIDTNLFEDNRCYSEESRNEEKLRMLRWLDNQIKTDLCIIMGHYPLFYYNKHNEFVIEPSTLELLDLILRNRNNIYYFASDKHCFQDIIHENIHQIIVGTGGADLDNIPEHTNEIKRVDDNPNKEFRIISTFTSYGYLTVSINAEQRLSFDFIRIDAPHPLAGGSKINMLNKRKYLKYFYKNKKVT